MIGRGPGDGGDVPPTVASRIGELCDRFEVDWRAGRRPRIEEILEAEPDAWQAGLLRQLLVVELAYRRHAGEAPGSEEYRRRFPGFAESIDEAFERGARGADDVTKASGTADGTQTFTPPPSVPRSGPGPVASTEEQLTFDGDDDAHAVGSRNRSFGDYELLKILGRGGMGVVYRARQLSLNRSVALKLIRPHGLAPADGLRRFQNEAEMVATLDHPHIVPIYEVGRHQDTRYFSMKLVEGSNLDRTLGDYQDAYHEAAQLAATVAEAVHHAHQRGVLHRDLK